MDSQAVLRQVFQLFSFFLIFFSFFCASLIFSRFPCFFLPFFLFSSFTKKLFRPAVLSFRTSRYPSCHSGRAVTHPVILDEPSGKDRIPRIVILDEPSGKDRIPSLVILE